MARRHRGWILGLCVTAALGCSTGDDTEAMRLRKELELARDELARARVEAEALRRQMATLTPTTPGTSAKPGEPSTPMPVEADPVAQLFSLSKLYNEGAVNLPEWSNLKTKVIEQIPTVLPYGEKRTIGARLLEMKTLYDRSAVTLPEHTALKARVLSQTIPKPAPAGLPTLAEELSDLQRAYNQSAISLDEWTLGKKTVTERLVP